MKGKNKKKYKGKLSYRKNGGSAIKDFYSSNGYCSELPLESGKSQFNFFLDNGATVTGNFIVEEVAKLSPNQIVFDGLGHHFILELDEPIATEVCRIKSIW
jgi:hypothetical protein